MKVNYMKSISLMLIAVCSSIAGILNAQEYREGFECCNIPNDAVRDIAFAKAGNVVLPLPCVTEWEVTNGSPSIFPANGADPDVSGLGGATITAAEGNWYGLLGSCGPNSDEGVALVYNFEQGNSYNVSMQMRIAGSGNGNVIVDIYLAKAAITQITGGACTTIPAVPGDAVLVFNQTVSTTTWTTYSTNFCIADSPALTPYTRMWIRVRNPAADVTTNYLLFDDIRINSGGGGNTGAALNCATPNILPKVAANGIDLACSQVFDNATNVGIATTSPVVKLHVNGDGIFRGTTRDYRFTNGGAVQNNTVVTIDGTSSNLALQIKGNGQGVGYTQVNTASNAILGAGIYGLSENATAGSEGMALGFNTQTGGGLINERMRITGNGSVGVGTSTPVTRLHVSGQSLWLTDGNGGSMPGAEKGLRMYYDNSNDRAMIFAHDYLNSVSKDILLQHNAGKLGIGVTGTPSAKLHVNVTGLTTTTGIRFDGLLTLATDNRVLTTDGSGNVHYQALTGTKVVSSNCATTTNLNFPYWNGTTNMLSCSSPININGTNGIGIGMTAGTFNIPACGTCGNLTGPTAPGTSNVALDVNGVTQAIQFFARSDERFKKDIMPIDNAIDIISKMKPVSYVWRANEFKDMQLHTSRQAGFLAQELMEAFPEAVAKDENGYYSVSYDMIIPIAIQAIKQQQVSIEELRKTLKEVCELGCDQVNFTSLQSITEGGKGAYLEQNMPNPSGVQTKIKYFIPNDWKVSNVVLMITDLSGKSIQSVTNHNTGETTVELVTSTMAAGIYNYTLVIDGKIFDTKKMIVE